MGLADIALVEQHESRLGNTPAGPSRWKRAWTNAQARPRSHGAKLFNWRVGVAEAAAAAEGVKRDDPYVLVHNHRVNQGRPEREVARREYACNAECMTMLMQLAVRDKKPLEHYVEVLTTASAGGHGQLTEMVFWQGLVVDLVDYDTDATCKVCALPVKAVSMSRLTQTVHPSTAAVFVPAAADVEPYVLIGGNLVKVRDIVVADLTERDYELLQQYGTEESRLRYMMDHGRNFDGSPVQSCH